MRGASFIFLANWLKSIDHLLETACVITNNLLLRTLKVFGCHTPRTDYYQMYSSL